MSEKDLYKKLVLQRLWHGISLYFGGIRRKLDENLTLNVCHKTMVLGARAKDTEPALL